MSDIAPTLVITHTHDERAEVLPGPPGRGKADNDDLLALGRLDLEPVLGTRTGEVAALGTLGHDALEALLVSLLEEFRATLPSMLAVGQQWMLRQNAAQSLFAL